MKQNKQFFRRLLAVAFWLAVWQAAAMAIGQEVFLVSPVQALRTLVQLLPRADFWQRVGFSSGRILLGFVLGAVVSVVLAVCAARWSAADALLAPVMQLVKATPGASFIILALVWVRGSALSVLISFLMVLPVLYGAVRNSATRYIWAVANHEDRPVRREIRRRLRGRRMAQLGTALCNLLLCVPFLWLAALQLKDTFLELCQQLVLAMSWNGRPQISPDVVKTLLPLTLTFFLTYMPLLPARRILTAAFAVREPRHTAPRSGQPMEEDPTLPKAIVPDWVRAENQENGASDRSADA